MSVPHSQQLHQCYKIQEYACVRVSDALSTDCLEVKSKIADSESNPVCDRLAFVNEWINHFAPTSSDVNQLLIYSQID